MGRTVPTLTRQLNETEAALQGFRRALRRNDQLLLDALLASARPHLAAITGSEMLLPFEAALLAMLLEQSRRVMLLEQEVQHLQQEIALLRQNHEG